MDDVTTREPGAAHAKEHGMSQKAAGRMTKRDQWLVEVDVYLVSVDPLDFHIESYLQKEPDTDLIFHNNCHPGFEVTFHFHDDTGDANGYKFEKHKEDAVWSQLGDGKEYCPTSEVWDIFKPIRLTEDRMSLVVSNDNSGSKVGKFQYALNVTNGTNKLSLDPGGNNMNGSSTR